MKTLTQVLVGSTIMASLMSGMSTPAIAITLTSDRTPSTTPTELLLAQTLNLPAFQLPALTGSYSVGTTSYRMSDASRSEILGIGTQRQLMTKVWYPSQTLPTTAPATYMPEVMANIIGLQQNLPPEVLTSIQSHAVSGAAMATDQAQYPVVFLSHGGAGSFLEQYTTLAEELASHGYIVVGVSHTHDAAVTVFPDGEVIVGQPQTWMPQEGDTEEQIYKKRQDLVDIRTADVRFVLDELEQLNRTQSSFLAGRMMLDQVGILGHSVGGMTAAEVTRIDARFRAAMGLDSDITQALINHGLNSPFLLLSAQKTDVVSQKAFEQARDLLFAQMGADAYSVILSGAGHASFSDLPALWPLLSQLFPLNPDLPEEFQLALIRQALGIGSIDEFRSAAIINTYSRLFFNRYLKQIHSPALQSPLAGYPEIADFKFQSTLQPPISIPEPTSSAGLGILAVLAMVKRYSSR